MPTKTTYEEEAEKMARTAKKLAEQHKRDRQIPKEEGVYQLPVVGAEEKGDEILFTVLLGTDEKREVSVEYPDDTEDLNEPLVRLLDWKDVTFQSFAQIGEIPVYTDGDDSRYELCVPTKDALNTLTLSNEKISTYKIRGQRNVMMTQRPLFWLTLSVGSVTVGSVILLLFNTVQNAPRFGLISVDALIFLIFTFLLLFGSRALWRSLKVKF